VSWKMMLLLAAIAAVVLAAAAPALATSRSPHDSGRGTFGKGNSGKNKDFSGLVDIGGGRKMYIHRSAWRNCLEKRNGSRIGGSE
jgi:hypothetical protein